MYVICERFEETTGETKWWVPTIWENENICTFNAIAGKLKCVMYYLMWNVNAQDFAKLLLVILVWLLNLNRKYNFLNIICS